MLSKRNNHAAIHLLCLIVGLLATSISQAADDYENHLRQMEAEAKSLAATFHKSEVSSTSTTHGFARPGGGVARERLPLGLQQDAFETILEKEFLGTFTFYQKLSSDGKRQVYRHYQQDNRITTIRGVTLKLL